MAGREFFDAVPYVRASLAPRDADHDDDEATVFFMMVAMTRIMLLMTNDGIQPPRLCTN